MASTRSLAILGRQARACTLCAAHLPHEPRPVFRVDARARILLIGQAPGAKVHETGVPWQDDSGRHLLEWLAVDRATFDDPAGFAIVPMGFCWPGRKGGGDLPPRPECAPAWHPRFLAQLPAVRLTLLIGQYAQAAYLGDRIGPTLTATVRDFARHAPYLPLPHPSWRSKLWMEQHPWFARRVLPALRARVGAALSSRQS